MTQILIEQNIFYGISTIAALAGIGLIMLLFMLGTNAEIRTILTAQIMKRPIIQIHTALKQTKLHAGKIDGKHGNENRYKLKEYGTKFLPLPEMVEHVGAFRHINYYSKCPLALDAKAVAAFRDVENLLKTHGILPTETILDVLITMSDEELNDLSVVNADSLQNTKISITAEELIALRTQLQNTFIKDGQFVWETAKNFVFLMQTETSRSLDESIAIAREQAIEDARLGSTDKQGMMNIIYIVTLLMGGVIAYKMLVG